MTTNGYTPGAGTAFLLARAMDHINSVPYAVTARWVFYRLLQDGSLTTKGDYKRFLGLSSKARKGFYRSWRPDTLADDTRQPVVRGDGYDDGEGWAEALTDEVQCILDRWAGQPNYVEIWFEAAAMMAQFQFHTNDNIPLLAFHGDISIPEKWRSARRLTRRWQELNVPVKILYFGDLDTKGMQIPESARKDVEDFARAILDEYDALSFLEDFEFTRVGLNPDHPAQYNIPENPERPGTYQWEGLDDGAAQELIERSLVYLDLEAFDRVVEKEGNVTDQMKEHIAKFKLEA